jgi:hypothetical protein
MSNTMIITKLHNFNLKKSGMRTGSITTAIKKSIKNNLYNNKFWIPAMFELFDDKIFLKQSNINLKKKKPNVKIRWKIKKKLRCINGFKKFCRKNGLFQLIPLERFFKFKFKFMQSSVSSIIKMFTPLVMEEGIHEDVNHLSNDSATLLLTELVL